MALYCGRCKKESCGCGCKCNCGRPTCTRCHIKRPLPVVSPTPCETSSCAEPSNVHICSLVIKKTEDVRKYHNSLVFVEEDNSTYWVDDDGIPVITYRMPMYVDDFNPEGSNVVANIVYDFKNNKEYIFDPTGEYRTIDLTKKEEA